MTTKIRTIVYPKVLDQERTPYLFEFLRDNIPWEDGIYSKRRKMITRKAYPVNITYPEILDQAVLEVVSDVLTWTQLTSHLVLGIYLNYYRHGREFAPSHKHDSLQLIISLGATRRLKVGSRTYSLKNGDVILFGKSSHGLLLDHTVTEGRISIAVFLSP